MKAQGVGEIEYNLIKFKSDALLTNSRQLVEVYQIKEITLIFIFSLLDFVETNLTGKI